MNEAIAKAENLDRELNTQKEILRQMEMTKKEYINKLKKELDTIEQRYQHLLNENAMIGEDFRSRALANIVYAQGLEQQIEELKGEIDKKQKSVDDKDLECVQMERNMETAMMQTEEYLCHFVLMREDRDDKQQKLNDSQALAEERKKENERILEEHEEAEKRRMSGKQDTGTMTTITGNSNIFKQGPRGGGGATDLGSSRGSGSLQSGSGRGRGTGGKQVGGGGRIANRPPPTGGRKDSRNEGQST